MGFVLNFGYKWLGEKRTHILTVDQFPGWFSTKGSINDKAILQAGLAIMEKADLLVAHYGDKFDRRFFQGRCAIHGLRPPPPTKQRDTWAIARRAFNFSSNRLGNLAEVLGLSEQKHQKTRDEWPGWWFRAMSGDVTAIHRMGTYCKQDVRTLEQVYLRLRPFDTLHPRVFDNHVTTCGICGGSVHYRGYALLGIYKYRRFQCTQCGRWDRERNKC